MADAAKIIALAKAMGGGGGGSGAVDDVQVNGTSVVQNGVANIPIAGSSLGIVKINNSYGVGIDSEGRLQTNTTNPSDAKSGTNVWKPIVPVYQHTSTFYGLAKAAGADMKDISSTTVGVYPETQKSAITQMISGAVSVSGTTPSIDAKPGVRYICGEVEELDITVPATGIIDVIFTSGTTPTVLTVTPPTGVTIKWMGDFDPTSLDADTTYEINIMDGQFGVVGSWT